MMFARVLSAGFVAGIELRAIQVQVWQLRVPELIRIEIDCRNIKLIRTSLNVARFLLLLPPRCVWRFRCCICFCCNKNKNSEESEAGLKVYYERAECRLALKAHTAAAGRLFSMGISATAATRGACACGLGTLTTRAQLLAQAANT